MKLRKEILLVAGTILLGLFLWSKVDPLRNRKLIGKINDTAIFENNYKSIYGSKDVYNGMVGEDQVIINYNPDFGNQKNYLMAKKPYEEWKRYLDKEGNDLKIEECVGFLSGKRYPLEKSQKEFDDYLEEIRKIKNLDSTDDLFD